MARGAVMAGAGLRGTVAILTGAAAVGEVTLGDWPHEISVSRVPHEISVSRVSSVGMSEARMDGLGMRVDMVAEGVVR